MLAAAKWVMGIVPSGVLLGALLGTAADPDMKAAPAPWWRLTGASEVAVSGEQFAEAWPEDLSVPTGYRPDLDYDAEVRALPIPAHELAPLNEPPAMPEDALPTVTYGVTAAEDVADQAEAAAEDALAADAPAPEPAPDEPRKSELAAAGLY